jgi:uncharacterized protein
VAVPIRPSSDLGPFLGRVLGLLAGGLALAAGSTACGSGTTAAQLVRPPTLETRSERCRATGSRAKPLIVEWPSADRLELEARAKSGLMAVSYSGCEMRLLSQCRVPGRYVYTGTTPKTDTITMRDADDLYATIPGGAARFEGKLARAGQLSVTMTMVGRLSAVDASGGRAPIEGVCAGATHVIVGVTLGAFEFFTGGAADVRAEGGIGGIGAQGRSTAGRETLTRDGSPEACLYAKSVSAAPPERCAAALRVEVVPLESRTLAFGGDVGREVPAAVASTSKPVEGGTCAEGDAQCGAPSIPCPPGARSEGGRCVSARPFTKECSFVGDCTAACDAGRLESCVTLGKLYDEGKGATRDFARAAASYATACDGGHIPACVPLGHAYANGRGVLSDPARGLSLYERACAAGVADGCESVANVALHGMRQGADGSRPMALLKKACDLGKAAACTRIGYMLSSGHFVPRDRAKAREMFDRACRAGDQGACRVLGSNTRW